MGDRINEFAWKHPVITLAVFFVLFVIASNDDYNVLLKMNT